jgi:hypothetical protein
VKKRTEAKDLMIAAAVMMMKTITRMMMTGRTPIKQKVKGSIWEVESDEENEWNEQGSTDGDINKNDKSPDDNDASDNDEEEGDSNKKKSGGTSDIRDDDDMTDIDRMEKKKGRGKKGRGMDDCKLGFLN